MKQVLGRIYRRAQRVIHDPVAVDQRVRERWIRAGLPYWRSTKGIHAGRCGFVIGNGPSLRIADLDRLRGEVTIASNKIFLAFERTEWRPTYYTVVDDIVWRNTVGELHDHADHVFIPDYLKVPKGTRVKVSMFRSLPVAADHDGSGDVPFSADAVIGFHGGNTVTYENIQLAMHLGLDPIYLVGCDHFYGGSLGLEGEDRVTTDQVRNHFLPNYTAPGDVMNPALVSRMTRSYECAQRYAQEHGRSIYNATRGGHLEVFPRVDLDELIARSSLIP